MPKNAMQMESATTACVTLHRITGVMRGASLGIVAFACLALMPIVSQAKDISKNDTVTCEDWGMTTGGPDYVCVVQVDTGLLEADFEEMPDDFQALETATVASTMAWVATISGFPTAPDVPRVLRARSATVAILPGDGILPNMQAILSVLEDEESSRKTAPYYSDADRTIYVPVNWTGADVVEFSGFVHEMVHHLQNAAGKTYGCPQQRNALAYEVQERWLALFDRSLERDFGIDKDILMMSTQCIP